MANRKFPFKEVVDEGGAKTFMPYLPLKLLNGANEIDVAGLLDTGATINVMPYDIGVRLGAVWEELATTLTLSGNLGNWEARGLIVTASVEDFDQVRLAFAWTKSNQTPVILGQVNFFMLFNVCFFRQQLFFDLEKISG